MNELLVTSEGWIRTTPSDEIIKWALAIEAEGDRLKPNDMVNFSNRRYQGFVAEWAFNQWLGDKEVPHIWNGGTDPKPDFELQDLSTGVKCCGSKRPWSRSLVVNVYERHRRHDLDELFFVGWEHPGAVESDRPTVLLLGGLPAGEYFNRAIQVKPGEALNRIVEAKNHVWNLHTHQLEPPLAWLERVLNRSP